MKELNWRLHFPIEVGFLLILDPKKLFIALFPFDVVRNTCWSNGLEDRQERLYYWF